MRNNSFLNQLIFSAELYGRVEKESLRNFREPGS